VATNCICYFLPGINTSIVNSSNRTALDTVRDQKTQKAIEIAQLIAGKFIQLCGAVIVSINNNSSVC